MYCPFCRAEDTKVIDSRLASEGTQVRRRRECLACGEPIWGTLEEAAKKKGFSDEEIEIFVKELNALADEQE